MLKLLLCFPVSLEQQGFFEDHGFLVKMTTTRMSLLSYNKTVVVVDLSLISFFVLGHKSKVFSTFLLTTTTTKTYVLDGQSCGKIRG